MSKFDPACGLPTWTYTSEEVLGLEYERLILPSWQFACHVNEVKEAGAYATLDLGRDSIAVIRDRDGLLHAFKNVCRHRGSRLLDGQGRCRGAIVCRYHGWTYALDGRLKTVAAPRSFPGIDMERLGLHPVDIEVFHGLVFVRVIGGGPSLAEMWGEYSDLVAPYGVDAMEPTGPVTTEVWNCNWKVAVENNLENYHIPLGHPGYDRMLDNDLMGFGNAYGVTGSRSMLKDELSSNPTERFYQKLAPEVLTDLAEDTRRTWLFFAMLPNTGIDVYPDSMDVFQILPRTATTCTLRYPVFGPPDQRREARIVRYLNARINRQVSAEDKSLSERVQRGVTTHGYQPGPLSKIESGLRIFHDSIRGAIPEAGMTHAPSRFAPPPAQAAE
ncbi:MAG TPA: aromatic ring-hydroxylating dioxygenase subunit alpha [Aestuariivirgaceae bacterium]|nr:aromatic ring-hydroxylating dioxygenase subunit alpha [Aestuariivirgaceae bacterium]